MALHPEGALKQTTPSLKRERKLERERAGTAHATLVLDTEICLG
jgi:hypothetical protein